MLQKARYLKARPALVKCVCCPRMTDEPRKGMCQGCYGRRRRGSALPVDARCTCGQDNPIALLRAPWGVTCYNCRALAAAGVLVA